MPISSLEISEGGRWLELPGVQCSWEEGPCHPAPAQGPHSPGSYGGPLSTSHGAMERSEPQNHPVAFWDKEMGHPLQKSVWGHWMLSGRRDTWSCRDLREEILSTKESPPAPTQENHIH